jgi:glycogen debranching enzyme
LGEIAASLRAAFVEAYWQPDEQLPAMALDGDKRPLNVVSSNAGHCLWAGILPEALARQAAERLSQPDIGTRFGLRTLGSDARGYDPRSYHRGSIWPHDTAIAVAGLTKAGEASAARRLSDGLLDAARRFGWRLPELFCVPDPEGRQQPEQLETACDPQAWSATAPMMLLRSLLRFDPDVPEGTLRIAPLLHPAERLTITGIPVADSCIDLTVQGRTAEIHTIPEALSTNSTTHRSTRGPGYQAPGGH